MAAAAMAAAATAARNTDGSANTDGNTGDVGGSGTTGSSERPPDEPNGGDTWQITGDIAGEPTRFEDDDTFNHWSSGAGGTLARFNLSGAHLWVWPGPEHQEGVLRLPFDDGVQFICLANVETEEGSAGLSFKASGLSRLECDSDRQAPLCSGCLRSVQNNTHPSRQFKRVHPTRSIYSVRVTRTIAQWE